MSVNTDRDEIGHLNPGPSWLVSVRNSQEASIVGQSPIEILDIKEPDQGSLGRASSNTIRSILSSHCNSSQQISVAMGELIHIDFDVCDWLKNCDPEQKIRFVKFGLAESKTDEALSSKIKELISDLPCCVEPVLSAYVDHQNANALDLFSVLNLARELRFKYLLLDTFDKSAENFFHYVKPSFFNQIRAQAKRHGMRLAIAGKIGRQDISDAIEFEPDVIGVRGAVCENGSRRQSITNESLSGFLNLTRS